jgi:Spy/CpxP family protein refolding chaperone
MKTNTFSRATALVLIGAALAAAPARALGQVTTVSGRVVNELGVGVNDVPVYAWGEVIGTPRPGAPVTVETAETRTSANGSYTLKIPFGSKSRYHEVRVRVEGYMPETHTVLAGGTHVEDFRLRVDPFSKARPEGTPGLAKVVGRVSTEAGVGIDSAQVYINDLNLMVRTNASGEYSFETAPINRLVNLRVRAIGHVPSAQPIRITAGLQEVHFRLKSDPNSTRDEMPVGGTRPPMATKTTSGITTKMPAMVQGTEPARIPFETAVAQQMATTTTIPADPFGRFMFTPEQVMQYQNAIGLKEAQRERLQSAIQETQAITVRLQWALAQDTEKLTQLLSADPLVEKEVLAQTDRIMTMEREIKRAQMSLLIKIRNTLTAEQQARLRQLRGHDD